MLGRFISGTILQAIVEVPEVGSVNVVIKKR